MKTIRESETEAMDRETLNLIPPRRAPTTMAKAENLETERLLLEPQAVHQFEEWYLLERARDEAGHRDLSRDEAWLRLCAREGMWSAFGCGLYVVRDRVTRRMIGEAGLQFRRRSLGERFDAYPEASWAVSSEWQHRGIAAEAMQAVLARWFTAGGGGKKVPAGSTHARLVALVSSTNVASIRLAERLGFLRFDEAPYGGTHHFMYELI